MSKWTGKSRGGLIGYSFFVYTLKWFGVGTAYALLEIVYPFYFWFEKDKKANLIKFYQAVGHDTATAKKIVRKNFKVLGQCLIDRVAFLIGKGDEYTFSLDGEENLLEITSMGKGGLLLSAHLGNWEIAGNLLIKKGISSNINVLMLDAEHKKIKDFLVKQTNGQLFNIIPITDDFSYLVNLKEAVTKNEMICLHGDRFLDGSKTVEKSFFGKRTIFPAGPFELGVRLNIPVCIVYAIKTSKRHYALQASKLIENSSGQEISDLYISKLESLVRQHPEQWFNYYDYFEKDTGN